MKSLDMFQKLCGNSTPQNVVIITPMWGEINPRVGDVRKMTEGPNRYNTVALAINAIRLVLDDNPPLLRIRVGPTHGHKDISRTSAREATQGGSGAGKDEVMRFLGKENKRMQEEMERLETMRQGPKPASRG